MCSNDVLCSCDHDRHVLKDFLCCSVVDVSFQCCLWLFDDYLAVVF